MNKQAHKTDSKDVQKLDSDPIWTKKAEKVQDPAAPKEEGIFDLRTQTGFEGAKAYLASHQSPVSN